MDDDYCCKDSGLTEIDLMEFADLKLNRNSIQYDEALQSLKERKYGENEVEINRYISEHILQCQDCHLIYDQQKEGVRVGNYLSDHTIEDGPSVDDLLAGIKRKLTVQSLLEAELSTGVLRSEASGMPVESSVSENRPERSPERNNDFAGTPKG